MRFIAIMGGTIVCYSHKYTIKSVNPTDLVQAYKLSPEFGLDRRNIHPPEVVDLSSES